MVRACLSQKRFPELSQQFLGSVCPQLVGGNDPCKLLPQPFLERLSGKLPFPVGHLPRIFPQEKGRENALKSIVMFDFFDKNEAGQQEQTVKVRRQPFLESLVKLQYILKAYRNLSLAQLLNE